MEIMTESFQLTPTAQGIIQLVEEMVQGQSEGQIGLNVWMKALLSGNAGLLQRMAVRFEPATVMESVEMALAANDPGKGYAVSKILKTAGSRAKSLGKNRIGVRDIAAAVLVASGYDLKDPSDPVDRDWLDSGKAAAETVEGASEGDGPPPPDEKTSEKKSEKNVASSSGERASGGAASRFKIKTPEILKQFGRDLTQEAVDGRLPPIIGRGLERQLLIETLCRRTKRNPILVGPAGVGKTAIVEGFAQMVAEEQVPDILKGQRVIAIQPSAIVAGARYTGELEKRMQAVIQASSQDGIILFMDEFHSAVGTGGTPGTTDMASILKPVLARGELACIAATTNHEYRRFVEPDGALERRFQPIRINELSPEDTLLILRSLEALLQEDYQIAIEPAVAERILDYGKNYMHNRHFPDKAVDLLEQCFAHALANDLDTIGVVEAQAVAQRMIGMPLDLTERLEVLKKTLRRDTPLRDEEIDNLVNRLQVTMRGLDLRNTRPNAVLLLLGSMQENSRAIARALSTALFSVPDRVVSIDLSRMAQPEDINLLVGAPPGYVGYSDSLPLHQVVQMPWCILRLEHFDVCHPQIRDVLTQAISEGVITDGRGQSIFLSDAILLISTALSPDAERVIGFTPEVPTETRDVRSFIRDRLGEELMDQVDIFLYERAESGQDRETWIREVLLEALNDHYAQLGISLVWDDSLIAWLVSQKELDLLVSEWSRFLDDAMTPVIIAALPRMEDCQEQSLRIYFDGSVQVALLDGPLEEDEAKGKPS